MPAARSPYHFPISRAFKPRYLSSPALVANGRTLMQPDIC
jgi:hypothetical protein